MCGIVRGVWIGLLCGFILGGIVCSVVASLYEECVVYFWSGR